MANYFDEMGWEPLGEGESPNHLLHLARLLLDYNMFEALGEHNRLPPPASKKAIEEMETEKIADEGLRRKVQFQNQNLIIFLSPIGQQCPVCLKAFAKDEVVKKLACSHKFHTECIIPWLTKVRKNEIFFYAQRLIFIWFLDK